MSDLMNANDCKLLDDFLDHDLVGENRQRFVEHLESCADCREVVDAQRSFAQRLQAAIARAESSPPEMPRRIDRRIRQARLHRVAVSALAASIALAALWLAIDRPPRTVHPPQLIVGQERPTEEPTVRIRFPNRDVIAMPVAFDSPHVTVVMVYPELQAAVPAPLERDER